LKGKISKMNIFFKIIIHSEYFKPMLIKKI